MHSVKPPYLFILFRYCIQIVKDREAKKLIAAEESEILAEAEERAQKARDELDAEDMRAEAAAVG